MCSNVRSDIVKGYVGDKLRGMCKKMVVFVYIEAPAEEAKVLDRDKMFMARRKILECRSFRLRNRRANHSPISWVTVRIEV